MKTATTLIFLSLFTFLCVEEASACLCDEMGVPTCAKVARADAVFVGTVRSIKAVEQTGGDLKESLIQFEVEEVYKGTPSSPVDVGYIFGTSCSWLKFEIGERWLVFGFRKSNGGLSIPFCSYSHPYEPSERVEFLDDYRQKKVSESIQGYLTSLGRGPVEPGPITDAKITITGDKTTLSAQPDKDGRWQMSVPGPGKYSIKVSIPFAAMLSSYQAGLSLKDMKIADTQSVVEYESEVQPGLCSYQELDFDRVDTKATGSISGRLLDSDGNPTSGTLNLQRWSLDEKNTLESGTLGFADENGNYSFDGLREGRYVIVLNRDGFPEKGEPYLRNYLPGVSRFSGAFVIELAQGKAIEAPDFKLPKKLTTRSIEIEASLPDGKPVINWGTQAASDRLPSISLYRADGRYIELPDVKRTGTGKYTFPVYEGFPYVVQIEFYPGNGKTLNGFAQIPKNGVPKTIKIELGQKYAGVLEFLGDPSSKKLP
jgi:hypothetical protein